MQTCLPNKTETVNKKNGFMITYIIFKSDTNGKHKSSER